jgi:hypothetical protein
MVRRNSNSLNTKEDGVMIEIGEELEPNWDEIVKCPIWKILGVIECNGCDSHDMCWKAKKPVELEHSSDDEDRR